MVTDRSLFPLKTEAPLLCREVVVSYSITEAAVSFLLDDVMPQFPGYPKFMERNLSSFGLFVSSDGWKVNEPVFSSMMAMLCCPHAPIRDLN